MNDGEWRPWDAMEEEEQRIFRRADELYLEDHPDKDEADRRDEEYWNLCFDQAVLELHLEKAVPEKYRDRPDLLAIDANVGTLQKSYLTKKHVDTRGLSKGAREEHRREVLLNWRMVQIAMCAGS